MDVSQLSITGKTLARDQFIVAESNELIDMKYFSEMLSGRLAAYRIRKFIPIIDCQQIASNFWNSKGITPRSGYGQDGIEGYFLGPSHIEKTSLEYLLQAQSSTQAVNEMYHGAINPAEKFRNAICENSNLTLRPAQLHGLQAANSKAVCWNNTGEFLLEPHEDFAQTKDPRQFDFEIQQVKRVVAFNFYADVPLNAGFLKLWNIEPDDETRAQLDLTYSGYPYPQNLLHEFAELTIAVETGDICIINGNLIHAVMRGQSHMNNKNRIVVSFFMAVNNQQEIIWWT